MTRTVLRRISVLVACAFYVLSAGIVLAEDKYSAEEMYGDCQAILSSAKSQENSGELELDNTFATGTCWGAFLSLQQIIVTKRQGGKNTILNICVPPDATLLQLIQVFGLFVQSNTERKDEPFTKVAIAAMRSAFPCK